MTVVPTPTPTQSQYPLHELTAIPVSNMNTSGKVSNSNNKNNTLPEAKPISPVKLEPAGNTTMNGRERIIHVHGDPVKKDKNFFLSILPRGNTARSRRIRKRARSLRHNQRVYPTTGGKKNKTKKQKKHLRKSKKVKKSKQVKKQKTQKFLK